MIRNDLKIYLQENHLNINEIFLAHRDIDPGNYRVGKISKENTEMVVVLNEITGDIMDYFYDDTPNISEFDISDSIRFEDGSIEPGKYFVDRDGRLRSTYTNRYLNIQQELYPIYTIKLINTKKRTGHSKRLQIHKIVASVFIPNIDPEKRTIIDHINRDVNDYSMKNLRWVTSKENAMNSKKRFFAKRRQYISYKDKYLTMKVDVLSDEELLLHPKYKREIILDTLHSSNYHYGLYWQIIDLNLSDYLSAIGKTLDDIDDNLWTDTRITGVKAHPLGLLKITTQTVSSTTYITPGYEKYKEYKYLVIRIRGKAYLVHRIIAETFLNGKKEIMSPYEVDHISTIPTDNRVENLQICTHKENVNNIKTKIKLSTPVIAEGRCFNSITDCSNYYSVARSTIVNWIKTGKNGFYFKKE